LKIKIINKITCTSACELVDVVFEFETAVFDFGSVGEGVVAGNVTPVGL
jgi:hypothetical protein